MSETRDRSSEPYDGAPTSPEEMRELRAVAALLRGLPDPEPPATLFERVMTAVQARESRPRVVRGVFRRLTSPAAATALAAGLATLAVVTAIRQEATAPQSPLQPMRARPVADAGDRPEAAPSFVVPARSVRPVRLFGGAPVDSIDAANDLDVAVVQVANLLDHRLDQQINRLLLDPLAFYDQVERATNRELLIQRISDRAGERGDAAEIALQVRKKAPDHPLTSRFIDRLLRAALIEYTARR